jgi:CBS-domain-containing membrane protein
MLATSHAPTRLTLRAQTAAELMRPDPVSLRDDATMSEALTLFADKGLTVAPVIDKAGKPIGVLSSSDILVHERERSAGKLAASPDPVRVRDLMTPAIFAVAPDTPAAEVVAGLLTLSVHHLFVVDADGVLVGVISAADILRSMWR